MVAFGQSVSGMFAGDEVVKGAMAGYVFENMEIASYTVLIAAAQAAGDEQTENVCRQIIAQEHAMAAAFLARSATPGVDAKVQELSRWRQASRQRREVQRHRGALAQA